MHSNNGVSVLVDSTVVNDSMDSTVYTMLNHGNILTKTMAISDSALHSRVGLINLKVLVTTSL